MPGTIVGKGSVVMSNSTVIDRVPPYCLVGGVPASMLRKNIRRVPDHERKIHIVRNILREFEELLRFKKCSIETSLQDDTYHVTTPDGTARNIIFLPEKKDAVKEVPPRSIVLIFGRKPTFTEKVSIFDLKNLEFSGVEDRLSHELRNFLRRRGIRFRPYAWDASFKHGL
jgi:hypothetical protein